MGSYSGACEIVEVKEEMKSVNKSSRGDYRSHSGLSTGGHDRKPPVLKLGLKDSLQDDIHHLFESISIKNSSKSLDLTSLASTSSSPLRKNAMKRPITMGVPQSQGMGSSEPVSLKQALRELCLSKASEMAAMKRLSMSSSSPVSEAGRIKSLYNSVVVETSRSGIPIDGGKGNMVAISLVPEDSKSISSGRVPKQLQVPKKYLSQSAQSSPRFQTLKSPYQSVQSSPCFQAVKSTNQSAQSSPRLQALKSPNQSIQSSPPFTVEMRYDSSPRLQALKSPNQSIQSSPPFTVEMRYDAAGTTSMQNDVVSAPRKVRTPLKSPNQSALSSPTFAVPQVLNGIGKIPTEVDINYATGKVGRLDQKSPTQRAYVSPQTAVPTLQKGAGAMSLQTDNLSVPRKVGNQALKTEVKQRAKKTPVVCDNTLELDVNVPTSTTKLASKLTASKSGRKGRLHSAPSFVINGNRVGKLTRSSPRLAKPNVRTKGSVKKKIKQASGGSSKEANKGSAPNTGQLVCQKCQCTLKDAIEDSDPDVPGPNPCSFGAEVNSSIVNSDSSKPEWTSSNCNRSRGVGKATTNSKSREKGDFSQSSKSSLGDYSTSTSNSDESNASRPSCGNKPHMSKDARWEAIRLVKKQHGVLSLRHFNLLKKLGCGDIGTVYLAELIGSNCMFAIKVMDNEFLARRKKMPRAQTEREILRMLDHPFLPTLYAQFTSDNLSCLVMEFCPGGDLHVLRQKQPGRSFPEQAARFYVAEVLLALEYLHMLGIIYRDLKPENILVREDGHIMLTDFDLSLRCSVNPTLLKSSGVADPARISGPCTETNCINPFCVEPACQVPCFSPRFLPATAKARKLKAEAALHLRSLPQLVAEPTDARSNSFVGTHEYLAPEIIKGEGHGAAVDWWTFGVFLYELIYGVTPFKGCGNEETLCNVVARDLVFPDGPLVSFQARDLIRGLLVKEPENRLGSEKGAAEIKQHPFFQGLNWALIRCAIPPELPDSHDFLHSLSQETSSKYLECKPSGEHLEFELF